MNKSLKAAKDGSTAMSMNSMITHNTRSKTRIGSTKGVVYGAR